MINVGYVVLAYTLVVAFLFKLGLLLLWSARLHAAHASQHRYWEIFGMMFGPKSDKDMDAELWNDFQPIQRKNIVSNVVICGAGFALIVACIAVNRLWH